MRPSTSPASPRTQHQPTSSVAGSRTPNTWRSGIQRQGASAWNLRAARMSSLQHSSAGSASDSGGFLRLDTGTADEWSTDDTGQPKFLRRRRPKQWFSLTAGLLLLLFSCRSVESVEVLPARAVFVVEVAGLERFKVELHEAGLIAAATALLGSGERAGVAGD